VGIDKLFVDGLKPGVRQIVGESRPLTLSPWFV